MEVLQGSSVDPIIDDLTSRVNRMNEKVQFYRSEEDSNDIKKPSNGVDLKNGTMSKLGDDFQKSCFEGGKFTDPSTIVPPKDLDELVSRLHEVFEGEDICVDYVQKLMTSYKSTRKEWKQFAKFDQYKYTRNLVNEGNGKFNLMILCWNEAQGSCIHSHADSHCFLKVLQGSLIEEQYEWPESSQTEDNNTNKYNEDRDVDEDDSDDMKMKKKGDAVITLNECAYINDSIGLHRVENESHMEKAVTLHLYSPPFLECQCFDERSGRVTTGQMTFWSKYGTRTPFGKYPENSQQPVEDN